MLFCRLLCGRAVRMDAGNPRQTELDPLGNAPAYCCSPGIMQLSSNFSGFSDAAGRIVAQKSGASFSLLAPLRLRAPVCTTGRRPSWMCDSGWAPRWARRVV